MPEVVLTQKMYHQAVASERLTALSLACADAKTCWLEDIKTQTRRSVSVCRQLSDSSVCDGES